MVKFEIVDETINNFYGEYTVRVKAQDENDEFLQWYDIWYEDDEIMIESNGVYTPDSIFTNENNIQDLYELLDLWIDDNCEKGDD